jgi:NAD(P)-dependent dehydrogenase (short-subunit alcohol dehydrogenase family)
VIGDTIDFSGRVAFVTGAARGIGRGTALVLARLGASVAACDINTEGGQETVEQIHSTGGQAAFYASDVSDGQAVAAAVEAAVRNFGRLDFLINNAGIDLHKPLMRTTGEEWDRIYAVDVKGIYHCCRAAVPHLARQGGAIVNIASAHAHQTDSAIAAYAGAKGAVLALSRSLALEVAPQRVRVNVVSPGFIETDIMRRWVQSARDPAARRASAEGLQPLGRMGTPEDIGHAVAFLLSGWAGFMTGAELVVDGGLSARLYRAEEL